MSTNGRVSRGRPDAMIEAGYIYLRYCGGSGGGNCLTPLGVTSVVFSIRVPKFIVHHRRIIFENKEFEGIRIYSNNPVGLCPNNLGVEQNWYMALSNNGILTDTQIMSRGILLNGALPYQIEFREDKIPQPVDGGYAGLLYVHVYWGSTGFLNEGGTIDNDSIKVVKHDYDIVL